MAVVAIGLIGILVETTVMKLMFRYIRARVTLKVLFYFFLSIILACIAQAETGGTIPVGKFSSGGLEGWEEKLFNGKTSYVFVQLGDTTALKADSKASASGLVKKITVDIKKYPYLTWRWRVSNRLGQMDEKQKSGDDYAARIYVVVSGGLFFWNTKAINYVWSSNLPKGTSWPNAFAGSSARMYAIRSSDDQLETWYEEKRNVYEDFRKLFGSEVRYIHVVALMTDTDNSEGKVVSYYGDITFSQK
ncbi:DUF3047 domain-containing protein [Alkalimarinus alittae]|uniref:DUF3047 domain-containing protein n=1 Tax=Alkalimarinus alittae TaxID=2961619 RepID=A0ABY6MXD9_9ALTE|nr:DUF3047 domain-containing protein [Alkalimarinus alittae]UZE94501.1 DUF3047 domain-containing protein [Alkalimarinus alittae]